MPSLLSQLVGDRSIRFGLAAILVRVSGLCTISHTRVAYPFAKRLEEKDGFNRRRSMGSNLGYLTQFRNNPISK